MRPKKFMKKINFYIIIGIFVLLLIAIFGYFLGMQKFRRHDTDKRDNGGNIILTNGVVKCENMRCFEEKLQNCSPAIIDLSGSMNLSMQIYGIENDKCHYEMKIGEKAGKSCLFERSRLGGALIKQLFGESVGLEQIVKESCRSI